MRSGKKSMGDDGFKRLVSRLPGSWENFLGRGISFFIREQEPERVRFNARVDSEDNVIGWEIKVDTDKENVRKAKKFWESNVEDRL